MTCNECRLDEKLNCHHAVGFNLDERIHEIHLDAYDFDSGKFAIDKADEAVKQLIRDVIEEVKPERRLTEPEYDYEESGYVFSYNVHASGHNDAIDEMEANSKRLGL